MKSRKNESEFGRGLVICLIKFAEHFERLGHDLERMPMAESSTIQMHFNAASDHLYNIEVPSHWHKRYPELCGMVKTLQNKALGCGHGNDILAKEEAYFLHKLSREIGLEIDKVLGLEPDMGSW